MKSREERDAMVKRVQDAAKKWPTFEKMPLADRVPVSVELRGDPAEDNRFYIDALYELSYKGATPIGRVKDAAMIAGEIVVPKAKKGDRI
jgi:hypothetical protein